jgi:hypothetical protein
MKTGKRAQPSVLVDKMGMKDIGSYGTDKPSRLKQRGDK